MMSNKIRQTSPTLDGIRDDHKERYKFAIAQAVKRGDIKRILDVGCGVGYGSFMMGEAGFRVLGIERDFEAFEFAKANYTHDDALFVNIDLNLIDDPCDFDMLTMFEIIEHTPDALEFLKTARAKLLVGSVPNEEVVPYVPGKVNPEHYRHFSPSEIILALNDAGWTVSYIGYQPGKHGVDATIQDDPKIKRTIVFVAERV